MWYCLIQGGGHDWPGRSGNMNIDATVEAWNFVKNITPEEPPSPADFNLDGQINGPDLSYLLSNWSSSNSAGDLNDDGATNAQDLAILLSVWTG